MSEQKNPLLAAVSTERGAGVRMAFALDSLSKPGFLIIHQVQLHTMEVKTDGSFDQTVFKMLHGDNDRRLALLRESFVSGETLGGEGDVSRN